MNAAAVGAAFARQAELCAQFAAPLYADLCRRAADEARAGGAEAADGAEIAGPIDDDGVARIDQ
ncbi:MAG TPA: hypothetical protein VFA35_07355, partial [Burkholderiaceae bacterium]|nr:hypothetical protein [Burkholderiaceae bacterium]